MEANKELQILARAVLVLLEAGAKDADEHARRYNQPGRQELVEAVSRARTFRECADAVKAILTSDT